MKINKTLETEDGKVEFMGELNSEELDLVLTLGLNFLLQQGALPFKAMKDADLPLMAQLPETPQ